MSLFFQKSDGDLVSIASFDQENGKTSLPYFSSSTYPTCGSETPYFDSLGDSTMVPCKQKTAPSSPNYPHYKESDSNGNDIRNDKNLNNSLCGSADADKTDVSHFSCGDFQRFSMIWFNNDSFISEF